MENCDLIKALFQGHLDAGKPATISSFRRELELLMRDNISELCSGVSRSHSPRSGGSEWRNELKAMFGGRGRKWVYIDSERVMPTLNEFESRGVDTRSYRCWIEKAGKAWVRYSGPRVNRGVQSAAFEVRTLGSTYDQPRELFYLPVSDIDDIEFLHGTPYSHGLEYEVSIDELLELDNDIDMDDDLEDDNDI